MNRRKLLAGLLPVRCIVFILVFVIGAVTTDKSVGDISNWWSVAASCVNIFTILLIVLAAKKSGSSYREVLNLHKSKLGVKKMIGIIIALIVIGTSGMYLAGLVCYGKIPYTPPKIVAPIPLVLAVINILVLPVTTTLAEDGLYLGCGVNSIGNKFASILIPSFFYAVQHCFIPTIFDAKYMIYRFLSLLPCAVIMCWYYQKKKDPVPIMIAHTILDIATAATILATSASPDLYDKMCNM